MAKGLTTTAKRSRLMSRVRQSGTECENQVRDLVRSLGHSYRKNARDLPGSPDIVNKTRRWAIFVNGCFWHAHENCHRASVPKRNKTFWEDKFEANRARDARNVQRLVGRGFSVLTVWECELQNLVRVRRRLGQFLGPAQSGRARNHSSNGRSNGAHIAFSLLPSRSRVVCTVRDRHRVVRTSLPYLESAATTDRDSRSAYFYGFLRQKAPGRAHPGGRSLRIADLFAGCGGLSLGVQEVCRSLGLDFKPVLALDHDAQSLAVYQANFAPSTAHATDMRQVINGRLGAKPTNAECQLLKSVGRVDVAIAGPPCQGYSDLNNHTRRLDDRNQLYERVGRFAELALPSHLLIENVPTVIHGHERALEKTLRLLAILGYHVDHGVVDLSSLGVPQRRKRHVTLASRKDFGSLESLLVDHRVPAEHSVRWAIEDLENIEPLEVFNTPSSHSATNRARINYLFTHDVYDLPNRMRPDCHRNALHSYKSMYGRMRYDEPAQTITSGYGSPGQGRFVHPSRHTTITPHEAARLQFFPDYFDFTPVANRTTLARMLGNAVPMMLSYSVFQSLLTIDGRG